MILCAIVAASDNGVIGRKNWLPWELPDELQYFRTTTLGKPVIMGRKTYESIGRPMPKRRNIVVTSQAGFQAPGCDIAATLQEAMEIASQDNTEEVFVIGGAQLYAMALPMIDRLYFTRVHTDIEDGDTFMPEIDWSQWKKISSVDHPTDEKHAFSFTMEVYERLR